MKGKNSVRALAVVFWIFALANLLQLDVQQPLALYLTLGFACVLGITGWGLWARWRWARYLAIGILCLSILYLLVSIFGSLYFAAVNHYGLSWGWWYVTDSIALLVDAFVLYVLFSKDVKKEF